MLFAFCFHWIFSSVTEVVWEGEDTEAKKADNATVKKDDKDAFTSAVNRLDLILLLIRLVREYKFCHQFD